MSEHIQPAGGVSPPRRVGGLTPPLRGRNTNKRPASPTRASVRLPPDPLGRWRPHRHGRGRSIAVWWAVRSSSAQYAAGRQKLCRWPRRRRQAAGQRLLRRAAAASGRHRTREQFDHRSHGTGARKNGFTPPRMSVSVSATRRKRQLFELREGQRVTITYYMPGGVGGGLGVATAVTSPPTKVRARGNPHGELPEAARTLTAKSSRSSRAASRRHGHGRSADEIATAGPTAKKRSFIFRSKRRWRKSCNRRNFARADK